MNRQIKTGEIIMEETKSTVVDLTKPAKTDISGPNGNFIEDREESKLTEEQIKQLQGFVNQLTGKLKRSKHAGQRRMSKVLLEKKKEKKRRVKNIAYASKRLNRQRNG